MTFVSILQLAVANCFVGVVGYPYWLAFGSPAGNSGVSVSLATEPN